MDTRERGTIKVLMLPWLGHGHISPFLELAKKLTSRNVFIYLCSTPINLSSIKKRVTENDSLSLELVELHLPTLPELPPHHQTTNGLPLHLHPTLKQAFDMSSSSFSNILQTLRPDLHRGPRRAPQQEAPAGNGTMECFVGVEKKIAPVGPLVQDTNIGEHKDTQIMQWLGTKDKFSTVFVSFGSESFLSKEEMEEMAHGLELSKVNFIWVVRFPNVGEKIELEEALPKGFLDRLGNRGLVVEDWAPQAQILAHSSTGGFVSHCGWNSILESLKFGVPVIAMPMKYDQPMNARLVEDVGVAAEVKR
ncbi:UDP-glucosyl transferase 72E1 [Actinidia rufa]|uniref:UDP-glucosyl transferase 72E1 n=1 Tax=Actinidia rufa TaxID=165716 RepID=A0A7J0DUX1_9ERIC|nr:UDP-glucosyl transferase 72E1 [Actinidia rufa]